MVVNHVVHGGSNGCWASTAVFNSLICVSLTFFQSRSQHLYRELKQIDDELVFEVSFRRSGTILWISAGPEIPPVPGLQIHEIFSGRAPFSAEKLVH